MDSEPTIAFEALNARQALIEAGIMQIAANGYDGASIEDIAQMANVSKGAFYYHFKSKEDFVHSIVRQRAAENIERFRQRDKEHISLSNWIEASFSIIINFPAKDLIWQQFSLEVMMAGMRQEYARIGALISELHKEWRALLAEMVVNSDEYRKGFVCCEPEVIAVGIMSLVDGLLMHSKLEPETFAERCFIERLAPLLKLWVAQPATASL